ncbi:MAG: CBS domain-containing protein [Bradyrhizobiaceae bacterium]|nr:CBS domain-containing protein [Bradyrhizobiaceae bacterium]
MKAGQMMTRDVVSIAPNASIWEAACLMLEKEISGLPVIDHKGKLVGILTEGDCLRRAETGTERTRPRWLETLMSPDRLANEYIHSHGRKVAEVMTRDVVTVSEDTPLEQIVHLMESRRIKRIPVLRGGEVVGIVSRANVVRGLASLARVLPPATTDDTTIRDQVLAELHRQKWAPQHLIDVTAKDGVVDLWGVVLADKQREAAVVAAENVPGVKAVRTHLSWVEPMSGMVFYEPEAQAGENRAD